MILLKLVTWSMMFAALRWGARKWFRVRSQRVTEASRAAWL